MIIASTSTIHGSGPLEYLLPTLSTFFKEVKTVLFIPYARPGGISYDEYTEKVSVPFAKINIKVNLKGSDLTLHGIISHCISLHDNQSCAASLFEQRHPDESSQPFCANQTPAHGYVTQRGCKTNTCHTSIIDRVARLVSSIKDSTIGHLLAHAFVRF